MSNSDGERLRTFWNDRYRQFSLSESGWLGAGAALNARLYACKADALRRSLSASGVARSSRFSVLDAGCGQGFFAELYAREYPFSSYSGVDLSSSAIAHVRAAVPGVKVYVGDLVDWRDPSGREFEVVQSLDVLHLTLDDDRMKATLENLSRLLAPSGVLLVTAALPETTRNVGGYLRYRSRAFWADALSALRLELSAERKMYYWLPAGGPSNRYARWVTDRLGPSMLYAFDRAALRLSIPQPAELPLDCAMRLLTLRRVAR